jgi:hypothetical protein
MGHGQNRFSQELIQMKESRLKAITFQKFRFYAPDLVSCGILEGLGCKQNLRDLWLPLIYSKAIPSGLTLLDLFREIG